MRNRRKYYLFNVTLAFFSASRFIGIFGKHLRTQFLVLFTLGVIYDVMKPQTILENIGTLGRQAFVVRYYWQNLGVIKFVEFLQVKEVVIEALRFSVLDIKYLPVLGLQVLIN